ncbi:MAG: glycosyltransferase [Acaryochloridaceae cyanobacterium RU_4_10]|nr:glycosyltransferase [Acaryochloridaceae cyanobacterium RU_4_10]
MKFSLILATIGRSEEPQRFLAALLVQTHPDYELILIDQNTDDRVERSLSPFSNQFPIVYIKTHFHGLSRARNLGLSYASGDIVGFPDDDCWYPPQLLAQVNAFFESHPNHHGLTVKPVDPLGRKLVNQASDRSCKIHRRNVLGYGKSISYCNFLRTVVTQTIGCFDESLGVGAGTPWEAGEETDYLLRAMNANYALYHCPDFSVHHPRKSLASPPERLHRALTYSRGSGRAIRKNGFPVWTIVMLSGKVLLASLYRLVFQQDGLSVRVAVTRIQGLIVGWSAKP